MDDISHLLASPGLLVAVLAIILVASVVQFSVGLGFGQIASPLLAVLDPALVPASVLFLGFCTATLGAVSERHAIHWPEVWPAVAARLVGVVAISLVLARIDSTDGFTLVFGVMMALAVVTSLAGFRLPFTRGGLLAMATLSGVMGTATSVGAPPMAIIYQGRPAAQARPTLAAYFSIGSIGSLAGLYFSGWAGPADIGLALLMAPAMLIGYAIARRLRVADPGRFRIALLSLAGLASCVLIARGLT